MDDYAGRATEERDRFDAEAYVHALPPSHEVWTDKFLSPKLAAVGLYPLMDGIADLIMRTAQEFDGPIEVVSLGAGNCDVEIDLTRRLIARGVRDFRFRCLEFSAAMLDRGKVAAADGGLLDHLSFELTDLNEWEPTDEAAVFFANHSLHHVVALEGLFEGIASAMTPTSRFIVNDMIGRNGHMRWPEALAILEPIWATLESRYKYNNQLRRQEDGFVNWDCSREGFEGVRAQDVLPCLMAKFSFELFVGYSNVSDVFVDRGFGPNFDMEDEADREFILRMGRLDDELIDLGIVKPTKVVASLRAGTTRPVRAWKHWTPEFCVRRPDDPATESRESLQARVEAAEAELVELRTHVDLAQSEVRGLRERVDKAEAEAAGMRATKTFRYTRPARTMYAGLRSHLRRDR